MPINIVAWLLKPAVVATVLSLGGLHAVVKQNRQRIDALVMGLVRDVGRYKSKKRRYNRFNDKGLVAFLRDNDPLEDLIQEQDALLQEGGTTTYDKSLHDLPTYTADELLEFGDGVDGRPILIGVMGRVYDVSTGSRFYGPEGSYGHFAGRDVTYSLCTGCKSYECVVDPPEGWDDALSEKQIKEGQRWLSFFHLHDKYPLVGKLQDDDPLEAVLKDWWEEHQQQHLSSSTGDDTDDGEKRNVPPILQ